MGLPEVFYGSNHVYFVLPAKNFLFELSPIDAVSMSSFAVREAHLRPKGAKTFSASALENEEALNKIEMIPSKLEVAQTDHWKKRDTSKIKDFTTLEVISDWTFSTPFKGSIRFLSNHVKRIKEATSLDLSHLVPAPLDPESKITVELTDEEIPYSRLSPQNPIVNFGQLYLFECDLEDSGYTMF